MITLRQFKKIFKSKDTEWDGDNACQGLDIIRKYLPDRGIESASHDIIYSVSIDDIIEAGITEEDVKKLQKLNWLIEDGHLACYV